MKLVEKELGFSDVAITNSSLEDVFMKVVEKFDVDEKKFYPYNTEDIDGNEPEIDMFEEVPNPSNNRPPGVSINKSSGKFKSMDPSKKTVQSRED